MNFRLVDAGWDAELEGAVATEYSGIRVISPFIKKKAAERLLRRGRPAILQVITRFNLDDFAKGVSDIAALRLLLESGARIRGIRNLHSKLYLFGDSRAIVTSANLTESALTKNHEFGFVAEDAAIIARCRQYFDDLWERGKADLTAEKLAAWDEKVTLHQARGAPPRAGASLGDEGADAGVAPEPLSLLPRITDAQQAFVKFFGDSANRAERSLEVFAAVERSGGHWACTYPAGKRPRAVADGALMFMGRLVRRPDDILIFGRATGMRHQPGRDDATPQDLALRPWKSKWPHYVRVHHAEFVAGGLSNGVSLNGLMEALGADAFRSTQQNAAAGVGNTNPRSSLRRQPGVELSPDGLAWMNERLERAFAEHGKLPAVDLATLDWPEIPGVPAARPA
jgi:hypothetical protein